MDETFTKKQFEFHKEKSLFGRYITQNHIAEILGREMNNFTVEVVGKSVKGNDINLMHLGKGKIKVFMWSQMHGNESTTTKSIFDLFNTSLSSNEPSIKQILNKCTIYAIPVLNPDGAELYTRNNANDIDLNRDAQNLSQPESLVLRKCFDIIKPDYCFNLHGQRTIFAAGKTNKPATISFLAPTQDQQCTITENRAVAMSLIVAATASLQKIIPDCVGVYDDSFNINCVGDYFQSQSVPTILFEAGHFSCDYQREYVRYLVYHSMLIILDVVSTESLKKYDHRDYLKIPENQKLYFDVIIRNAKLRETEKILDVAFQFKEILQNGKIVFLPVIEQIDKLKSYYGHRELNAHGNLVMGLKKEQLEIGYANDFVLINNAKILLKSENI